VLGRVVVNVDVGFHALIVGDHGASTWSAQ
jgi:hypothetical protein